MVHIRWVSLLLQYDIAVSVHQYSQIALPASFRAEPPVCAVQIEEARDS